MILMYSCMKESNHHKLEKNQNRHHFGQLPWSLKNPDGTHLALGRGWGWRKRHRRENIQAGTHLRNGKTSRMITN